MLRRLLLLLLATFAAHAEPLTIGETFTIRSAILGEERRINVYRPPADPASPLPVLYNAAALRGTVRLHYEPMPRERHATIYHPAALRAFRTVPAK